MPPWWPFPSSPFWFVNRYFAAPRGKLAADCAAVWVEKWQTDDQLRETVTPPTSWSWPMSEYTATIYWQRLGAVFTDQKYSRAHEWRFDGGATVPGSSSPHVVRVPYS